MTHHTSSPTANAQDVTAINSVLLRLATAETASCSCTTKTDDPRFHDSQCLYRVLRDAQAQIEQLVVLNDKYFWQVRDTCARAETAEAALAKATAA